MSATLQYRAELDVCSGARPTIKQLRTILNKLARVVPQSATIELEPYQYPKPIENAMRTSYWYVRAIARWSAYV